MRLVALLLVLLLQDPADKVRALVEKLGSDEITERDKAAAELVKLGPSILPSLRPHLEKAAGERKALLERVVAKVEREERLQKLLDAPPVVTLKVRDAEVEAVLADIAKQTGLEVEGFMLDASFKVSVSFDRVPLWKALDEIGRIHGGLLAHYYANRVLVEPGTRAGSPLVLHKGFGFHLRPIARTASGAVDVQAVITYAPGLPIWSTEVAFKELTDDLGKSLLDKETDLDLFFASSFSGPASPKNFATVIGHRSRQPATEGAVKLSRVRGSATIGLALDFKPILAIPVPAKDEEEASGSASGYSATVKATRKGKQVTVVITNLVTPDDLDTFDSGDRKSPGWAFAIRDKDGRLHLGKTKDQQPWADSSQLLTSDFTLPEGKEIATFEFVEPEKLTEVVIPFDFKDLPIPKTPVFQDNDVPALDEAPK